jgi:diguanylate cyclase (GGDEF)-like protein
LRKVRAGNFESIALPLNRPRQDPPPDSRPNDAREIAADVAAHAEAARLLVEENEKLRDFVNCAAEWCWETDEEHRYRDTDALLGRAPVFGSKDFVGKRRIDLPHPPEDRAALERHMEDLKARRPFLDLLYRVPNDDGTVDWIRASGKPAYDRSGVFIGYRGSASVATREVAEREALARESLALKRAEEVARIGHWRWSRATGAFEWSASCFDILGFAADAAPDLSRVKSVIDPHQKQHFVAAMKDLEAGRIIADREYCFLHAASGEHRYFQLRVDLEHDPCGQYVGTFGIIQDITERKLAELQLKERTQQLVEAQRMGRIGDWSIELGATQLWWSPEIFALLRLDPARFQPTWRNVKALYADGGAAVLAAQAEVARTGTVRSVDVQARRGDGTLGHFNVTSRGHMDVEGRLIGYSGTIQDITERKQAEVQLEKLAYHDTLTGLPNRALFKREIEDVLDQFHRHGAAAALFLLDLDRFKEINDSLGHAAGDELLVKVTHVLASLLGPSHFLARLGGDEFAVLLRDGGDQARVEAIAETLTAGLNRSFDLERGEAHIGTSIGVALIPRDGREAEELMRHADLALYRAKEEGRGRFAVFQAEMSDLVQRKTALARDLRHAIAGNLGLEARFQPQVDLATNRVVGFEALLRWNHAKRGYVPPSEFIPVAESSSLICDLGLWMMKEGALQAKLWLDLGEPERSVAVNVSAAQIWQTDFETDVARILDETGLPPHLLCLELTESLFADHAESRVSRALGALKRLGVTLALDDFGTGYSSLGYLTQLPFDTLKIDRVFVDGVVFSPRKLKLLEGIVAPGRGLAMRVIAEGAERPEEVAALREIGCDAAQGFIFSKPAIASEAITFAHACEAGDGFEPGELARKLRSVSGRDGKEHEALGKRRKAG